MTVWWNMLKINEIFYSIQMEGHNTGKPVIFVRFSGCNLRCEWCDTKHWGYTQMTVESVFWEIAKYLPCKNVILTGGEPTLQDYKKLCDVLNVENYWLGIETNGTNEIPTDPGEAIFNWITISPKTISIKQKKCDECKVVWTGKESLEWYEENMLTTRFYLQPCSNKNTDEVVKVVKRNPKWNLSIQTQKLINIP